MTGTYSSAVIQIHGTSRERHANPSMASQLESHEVSGGIRLKRGYQMQSQIAAILPNDDAVDIDGSGIRKNKGAVYPSFDTDHLVVYKLYTFFRNIDDLKFL
ncbi:MAG: hypothetical protein R6V78_05280 [Desulfosarcina sp.]